MQYLFTGHFQSHYHTVHLALQTRHNFITYVLFTRGGEKWKRPPPLTAHPTNHYNFWPGNVAQSTAQQHQCEANLPAADPRDPPFNMPLAGRGAAARWPPLKPAPWTQPRPRVCGVYDLAGCQRVLNFLDSASCGSSSRRPMRFEILHDAICFIWFCIFMNDRFSRCQRMLRFVQRLYFPEGAASSLQISKDLLVAGSRMLHLACFWH